MRFLLGVREVKENKKHCSGWSRRCPFCSLSSLPWTPGSGDHTCSLCLPGHSSYLFWLPLLMT